MSEAKYGETMMSSIVPYFASLIRATVENYTFNRTLRRGQSGVA
ncbi:hypothetical protein COXBURSA331_A1622 [Coxiella burnetii RSA 331]|nr:hypothetical protein COXBURSA331_A1622 [Coxiella burnetii RSA 331]EDR36097.1 hypothetical protein COXBURSA334_0504 [Coxiella burnetii Q321]